MPTRSTPYQAGLYAAVHTGNPGDAEFYVDACVEADPILELGCGTGRIASQLISAGHEVFGVDREAQALAIANAAGVVCVEADMRNFHIRRRFARIIVPYNGLYCLLSDSDVVRCLVCARRHLAPGGLLIFDGYAGDSLAPEDGLPYLTGQMQQYSIGTVEFEGEPWDVYEESRWNPATQRVDAVYTHIAHESGQQIEATIAHRYLTSHQLPELLEQAGLVVVAMHGDFEAGPFQSDSEFLIVRVGRWR